MLPEALKEPLDVAAFWGNNFYIIIVLLIVLLLIEFPNISHFI